MAEVKNFTPEQYREAREWYKLNSPKLYEWFISNDFDPEVIEQLCDVYFNLKRFKFDIGRNFFLVGVEYKSADAILSGKEKASLQIVNPHGKMMADQFAKNFLIAQLSKL